MKTCKTCGQAKSLNEYYFARKYPLAECKECWKERVRSRRLTDPSVREYDRRRAKEPKRRAQATKVTREWRKRNPLAYQAHIAVGNALRDGRMEKQPCQLCATTEHVHAHHKDYSKPLEVTWLCARCHHRMHALFPELEGAHKRKAA